VTDVDAAELRFSINGSAGVMKRASLFTVIALSLACPREAEEAGTAGERALSTRTCWAARKSRRGSKLNAVIFGELKSRASAFPAACCWVNERLEYISATYRSCMP